MADEKIPVPTVFKHKGKTMRLEPLGIKDTTEHAQYLRDRHVEEAMRAAKKMDLPVELSKHAYDVARREANQIQVGTNAYAKASQTLEGLTYSLWLSAIKHQPAFTLEEAAEALAENFFAAAEKANDVAGFVSPDPTKPV